MYNQNDVTLTQRRRKTPSFSSSLLDSICRSIDESNAQNLTEQQLDFYTTTATTTIKKQSHREKSPAVDSWMEKQSESGSSIRFFTNSSCSDSSYGGRGVTSSSSDESSCNNREKSRHCYEFSRQKSKHVRSQSDNTKTQQSGNREAAGGFSRTKLKALKIYGELLNKKPISPGGRISKILNSIFNSGSNAKKTSMCSSSSTVVAMEDANNYEQRIKSKPSNSKSSSSTRSCLSQSQMTTPSTRGSSKYVNGVKRSVTFYPVSVIVDEDSRPCGKKYIYEDIDDDPKLIQLPNVPQMIKSSTIKKSYDNMMVDYNLEEVDDDDDDAMSCASSDLFELDHVIANNGRYREELPVFETTNIKTNRAIANGFIRKM